MLLIYFSIFSQSCLKEDFLLLSYIGGFKPQNSKLNMAVHHKQMLGMVVFFYCEIIKINTE